MNDERIENLLRQAPRPSPPPRLKERLEKDVPLGRSAKPTDVSRSRHSGNWLRQWFPALSFGALLLGCLIVLGVETSKFLSLRQERDRLAAAAANVEQLRDEQTRLRERQEKIEQAKTAQADYQELLALREEADRWRELQEAAQGLQAENAQLKAGYAKALEEFESARGPDPFAEAVKKANSVRCINHIKQICLAAVIWSTAHDHRFPEDFLTMSNQISNPSILVCPADTHRDSGLSAQRFDLSNISYKILSPGAARGTDPSTVYIRCPIHGHIGLTDGSVQVVGLDAKFVTENGVTRWEQEPR